MTRFDWSVCHNKQKGREVTRPCSFWSTWTYLNFGVSFHELIETEVGFLDSQFSCIPNQLFISNNQGFIINQRRRSLYSVKRSKKYSSVNVRPSSKPYLPLLSLSLCRALSFQLSLIYLLLLNVLVVVCYGLDGRVEILGLPGLPRLLLLCCL